MLTSLFKTLFVALLLIISFGVIQNVQAEVTLQSKCLSGEEESLFQLNENIKLPLASVSKLFTTYWAIKSYDLNYQFLTKIYIVKTKEGLTKVHLRGGKDPFFGRQMVYFLVSELNKRGIQNIDELTFDENFILYWDVTSFDLGIQSARAFIPTFEQIELTLQKSISNNQINPQLYAEARSFVSKYFNIELVDRPRLFVKSIRLKTTRNFFKENRKFLSSKLTLNNFDIWLNSDKGFQLSSVPLQQYLKEMNLWSHNYVAEMLFIGLSNENLNTLDFNVAKRRSSYELEQFLKSHSNFNSQDFEFYNGSGDSEFLNGLKKYNLGTCRGVLRVLEFLNLELNRNNLNLENILGVSGVEKSEDGSNRGTLGKRYEDLPNTLIGKTGTVNPAINLAGVLATQKGLKFFSVFMGTESKLDWTPARDKIKNQVEEWIYALGKNQIQYTPPVNFGTDFIPYRSAISDLIIKDYRIGFDFREELKGPPKVAVYNSEEQKKLKTVMSKTHWFQLIEDREYAELEKYLDKEDNGALVEFINLQDEQGLTALMHASIDGQLKFIDALLRKGADLQLQSKYQDTALSLALDHENLIIAEKIRQHQ
ncbi:MAG TPA: D-alanyl-D-alanine carboxypeptidase [Pseudobdellovibrionaceae bacterium]|nr:D-alanyl-D-alanine carboxypeptidase [Pseudobdellovibrionaceae bacterium]